ncbi:ribosomal protein L21 [Filifactor alocis ATCC 35896]|uniref:Large ribosomal subunit protein bL21 n=1 Tax=Filifactor alocis (strain ATCC 35896 / CCUG 47790 / D40 B5) TaxID=546269 RepID=D6GS76_FILAD|nr:50S ribosomal protein L21 [Filifactor alocis]EFE28517.2 ribosomal protein L21 [Filifactor alocis ATCC 35896]
MYAVVETGGKQYRVQEGDVIQVEKLAVNEGEVVSLDVIALGKDGKVFVGEELANVKVNAKVVSHGKGKKVIVFKYKPKKDYRRKQGHRQPYTELVIETVEG